MKKIIVLLILLLLSTVNAYAINGDLTVNGTINAGSGGVRFQDGTVQKTAGFTPASVMVYTTTDAPTPSTWQIFTLPSQYSTAKAVLVECQVRQGTLFISDANDLPEITGAWTQQLLSKTVASGGDNTASGGSKVVPASNGNIAYWFANVGGNSSVYIKIVGLWF